MYLYLIERKSATQFTDKLSIAKQIYQTQNKYGDFSNEEAVHRMICDMAGGCKRKQENLLYFQPSPSVLFIQSDTELRHDVISKCGFQIRDIKTQYLQKDIVTNSIIKLVGRLAPTKTHNKKKLSIPTREEREIWVQNKLLALNTIPIIINEYDEKHIMWQHNTKSPMKESEGWLNGFCYNILAHVKDEQKLRSALHDGIGRGKAYGCGLLMTQTLKIL